MSFARLRRLRSSAKIRDSVSQTHLAVKDLIMPYFTVEGKNKKEAIKAMPGIYRLSVDNLIKDVKEAKKLGIKAILLFGVSGKKDALAKEAYRKDGIAQKAVRQIKENIPDMIVITDVCLCGYTTHGHCGVVKISHRSPVTGHRSNAQATGDRRQATGEFIIDNDETLKILVNIALSHAQAGADFVAPSAMMDGQVGAIRKTLDKEGFSETGILAYSAKYASSFYGPFREALDSSPQWGDRKSYQMDFRNSDEALIEIEQDIREGADIVMVKPALAYLDIIYRVKQSFNVPLAAYSVSGEYAMAKDYCKGLGVSSQGSGAEKKLVLEILTCIKRAGADLIITYHAKQMARWLSLMSNDKIQSTK